MKQLIKSKLEGSDYRAASVNCSHDPQLSILNGAKLLFALPDFDKGLSVTKSEWENDN